jgi:hypothetical protein
MTTKEEEEECKGRTAWTMVLRDMHTLAYCERMPSSVTSLPFFLPSSFSTFTIACSTSDTVLARTQDTTPRECVEMRTQAPDTSQTTARRTSEFVGVVLLASYEDEDLAHERVHYELVAVGARTHALS